MLCALNCTQYLLNQFVYVCSLVHMDHLISPTIIVEHFLHAKFLEFFLFNTGRFCHFKGLEI